MSNTSTEVRHAELKKGILFLEDGRRIQIVNWVLQCDARDLSGSRVDYLFRKRKLVRGPFDAPATDLSPGITKRSAPGVRRPVAPPPDLPVFQIPGAAEANDRTQAAVGAAPRPTESTMLASVPEPPGGAADGLGGEGAAGLDSAAVSLAADLQVHTVAALQEMVKRFGLSVSKYKNKTELVSAVVEETLKQRVADAS